MHIATIIMPMIEVPKSIVFCYLRYVNCCFVHENQSFSNSKKKGLLTQFLRIYITKNSGKGK